MIRSFVKDTCKWCESKVMIILSYMSLITENVNRFLVTRIAVENIYLNDNLSSKLMLRII